MTDNASEFLPSVRIDVDAVLLANSAEVRDGLAYVLGGAWSRCWPPDGKEYPYERVIPTIVVLRVPWGETNIQHSFRMAFRDADNNDLAPPAEGGFKAGRQPDLLDGASQVVVIALSPPVSIPQVGLYYVVVEVDEVEKKRIQFEAIENPAKPAVPRKA
jgi:hypothetical protein